MSHFKIFIALFLFFFTLASQAEMASKEPAKGVTKSAAPYQGYSDWNFEFSYVSWKEQMTLTNGPTTDHAYSDFIGNALAVEFEHYFVPRWGLIAELSFMSGKASLGGSQTQLIYQQSNVSWTGKEVSLRGAYRFSSSIISSVGPLVLNRQITIPPDPNGSNVTSGANVNYGLIADVRLKLDRHWEFRQTIGTLVQNAKTYWALAVGYAY